MRDDKVGHVDATFTMETLMQLLRAFTAILGLIGIIIGMVYVTRVFNLIYNALQAPESFQLVFEQWVSAVGDAHMEIKVGETIYPGARFAGILIIGGGTLALAWIAMAFMMAGAKMVSWSLGDRQAIKKILEHTLGSLRKNPPTKPALRS